LIEREGVRIMARSTIANMTVDEFRMLVREVVIQTLEELLGDPDQGLELDDDLRLELEQSLAAVQAGEKTAPASVVAARLKLTW
jgi:hypothetical protein